MPAGAALREYPPATAGAIAIVNHESSLDRCWRVLRRWPDRQGTAEQILDEEKRRAHFVGDPTALDRLAALASELLDVRPHSADTHLIAAEVASIRHHFAEARTHLAAAEGLGARQDVLARARLVVDQALGENLTMTLAARREMAEATGTLQDLVPLGALLADLGEFEAADANYVRAIRQYRDVSPFALAWVCFQLGLLWGETVPEPLPERAAQWYEQAISYLPLYTHARVHLAEIRLDAGEYSAAEALLRPVVASGDPEVRWRLAQTLAARGRPDEAARQREAARTAFEVLLARHELAFADHTAEFYLSSGAEPARALDLARINLANRPTLRAFELAHAAAMASGDERSASALVARAQGQWGNSKAFAFSPLAVRRYSAATVENFGADV